MEARVGTAYKFLKGGAVGPFSGFRWPLPARAVRGPWVETGDGLDPCAAGVHALRIRHLPYWMAEELWEAELGGETREEALQVIAERGRLVRRVDAWNPDLAAGFAVACAARGRRHADAVGTAGGYADDAERFAGLALEGSVAHAAVTAYVAAQCFGMAAAGESGDVAAHARAYEAERARQADLLAGLLGL